MHLANKTIINADGFGYSDVANVAILRSFQRFLVTSTSLLVNMPGFDNAVRLVHDHPLFSGRVGVRLNLSEGPSLTSSIRGCASLCQESGQFILNGRRRLLLLSGREKKALYEEMRAQLENALMAGIRPSHLDMHHSLHRQWPVALLLAKLGREYGIPRMRFFHNMGPEMGGVKGSYRQLFNRVLWKYMGVTGPDLSGAPADLLRLPEKRRPSNKYIEIVVCPGLDEFGELVDRDGKGLQSKLRPVIDHRYTIAYKELPVRHAWRDWTDLVNLRGSSVTAH